MLTRPQESLLFFPKEGSSRTSLLEFLPPPPLLATPLRFMWYHLRLSTKLFPHPPTPIEPTPIILHRPPLGERHEGQQYGRYTAQDPDSITLNAEGCGYSRHGGYCFCFLAPPG